MEKKEVIRIGLGMVHKNQMMNLSLNMVENMKEDTNKIIENLAMEELKILKENLVLEDIVDTVEIQ